MQNFNNNPYKKVKNNDNSLNDGTFFMGEMAVNPYGQEQAQINPVNPINQIPQVNQTNQTQNSYGNGINWGALGNTVKNTVSKIADSQIPNLMKNIYTNSFNNNPYGNSNLYGNNIYEDVKLPSYYNKPIYQQQNYQDYNFSKFDVKDTQRRIKNSISALEDVIQNSEITNDDVISIRNNMRDNLSILCNDIEGISHRKSGLPKIPTVESMRDGEVIEQYRKGTVDNASDALMMLNKAQEALKKNFNSVNMDSPEYYNKLYDYVEKTDELNKMSNSVRELFDLVLYSRPNAIDTVNRIRKQHNFLIPNYQNYQSYNQISQQFNQNGIPTGFAADIDNSLNDYIKNLSKQNILSAKEIRILSNKIKDEIQSIFDDFDKYIQMKIYKSITKEQKLDTEIAKQKLLDRVIKFKNNLKISKDLFEKYNKYVNEKDNDTVITNKLQFIKSVDKLEKMDEAMDLMKEILLNPVPKHSQGKIFLRNDLQKAKSDLGLKNNIIIDIGIKDVIAESPLEKAVSWSGTNWIRPVNAKINSHFKKGRDLGDGTPPRDHKGWDFLVKEGTPVRAIADGYVRIAEKNGHIRGYGNAIYINHGVIDDKIIESEYGHMKEIWVSPKQFVQQGEVIGLSGGKKGMYYSGISKGPHLHITIRVFNSDYKNANPVPPNMYIIF